MFQMWKAAESVHFHHSQGMLDPNTWVSWEALLRNYVNSPGFQTYWDVRSSVYSRAFQEWVAANMEHQDGRTAARLSPPGRTI